MDLTKFSFSDQFAHCVWPKRKVVSGFGLGILGSLIVLSVLLFNVSFNARLLTPMCQGFNTTWPFSFSSSSACSSSPVYNASVETNVTSISKDRNVLEKNQFGILPEEAKNRSFTLEEGKIMEKDLFENGSDVGKNENFTFKEGRVTEPGQFLNGSDMGRIANFTSSKGEGAVRETTHLGNSSEKVKSGSVNRGDVTTGKSIFGDNVAEGKSSNREDRATGNKTLANFSCSGDGVGSSEDREFQVGKKSDFNGNCDIFDGRWVRDEAKPYFPVGSCPYIDRDFDCYRNGRSDNGFLKWKWLPYGCDIPSLNATDFLERLKGKKLVFVGDSLNRNMWESLVCILRHSIRNKKRVYEISGRRNFKKKGFYAFRFEDYNCSVDFVSSPFLVRESFVKRRNGSFETLRLDLMDRTTSMYRDADIVVFNTGHWWTHEKTSKGEDYYQEGNHVYPRLKVLEAYRKALTTWARWVDTHIERSRTQVIFRGYSVTHFRGGQWNSGGQCHKETEPIFNESYLSNYPTKMKTLDHVIQEMKTPVIYLNISRLTDYRKDGHPSIYRKNYKSDQEKIVAEQSQDCSHWCLPGVPDTWNELLYASLLQTGKGS